MTTDKEKSFRVVDKRHSASSEESKKTEGEGFVMGDAEGKQEPVFNKIDFPTFILSLSTGAMIHLGMTPDPGTNKTEVNLQMARHDIDLLELIEEKTRGNLTPEEDQLVKGMLTDLRLRFVELSKKEG